MWIAPYPQRHHVLKLNRNRASRLCLALPLLQTEGYLLILQLHYLRAAAFLRLCFGLSRVSLTSKDEQMLHPNDAAYYFGFPSWPELEVCVEAFYYSAKATTIHDHPSFGTILN